MKCETYNAQVVLLLCEDSERSDELLLEVLPLLFHVGEDGRGDECGEFPFSEFEAFLGLHLRDGGWCGLRVGLGGTVVIVSPGSVGGKDVGKERTVEEVDGISKVARGCRVGGAGTILGSGWFPTIF